MVSSTFHDLEEHRSALCSAIEAAGMHQVSMEQDSALPGKSVIDSSLQKVRNSAAYVGIIGHSYGQIPDAVSNPLKLSLTELEFREARRLGRPIIVFIMSEEHRVAVGSVERSAARVKKLRDFREEVKRFGVDFGPDRVYREFDSIREFAIFAERSMAELRRYLDQQSAAATESHDSAAELDSIPVLPNLYAEPRYVGSHAFIGRADQLVALDGWARSEQDPVFLFEAIGGAGKSMLTWEWTTRGATHARPDFAGRFWYSFYEKGAVMADFCARALAYMTRRPISDFVNMKATQLAELLLRELEARPWLVVLDGLERVLVAYHRYDAAQVVDEQAGILDFVTNRDPCAAIRPLDDDLLRNLCGAAPSKILITSRLVPRAILNSARQPVPGVVHYLLRGLRPEDAENLLRRCGVNGSSGAIQNYLQRHCECHPLVAGVISGLVNDYLRARGQFDAWAADPNHGGMLDLGELDLVQKRNHILRSALDAVPEAGQQLLSALALLFESADFQTLRALNPHGPSEPQFVPEPTKPEETPSWESKSTAEQHEYEYEYIYNFELRTRYLRDYAAWERSAEVIEAQRGLRETVVDLERRGLLQYDRLAERYDLHPVVRAVVASGLGQTDQELLGQRVVDHFSAQMHDPFKSAENLHDLHSGLTVVRTLLRMGRVTRACVVYREGLGHALHYNLEAFAEILSLMRPFFGSGWASPRSYLNTRDKIYLATEAAIALNGLGEFEYAIDALTFCLESDIVRKSWRGLNIDLCNLSTVLESQNRLAQCARCTFLALESAEELGNAEDIFRARLLTFENLARSGEHRKAEVVWRTLQGMGQHWSRSRYRPGDLEALRADHLFGRNRLTKGYLRLAEKQAHDGRNRKALRALLSLRGKWCLQEGDNEGAIESLSEAVRVAREAGLKDNEAESWLALARVRTGSHVSMALEVDSSVDMNGPAHLPLAMLWNAIGDAEQAKLHALAAYYYAWADGPPHVRAYQLRSAKNTLRSLGIDNPNLPPYGEATNSALPWEKDVLYAISRFGRTNLDVAH